MSLPLIGILISPPLSAADAPLAPQHQLQGWGAVAIFVRGQVPPRTALMEGVVWRLVGFWWCAAFGPASISLKSGAFVNIGCMMRTAQGEGRQCQGEGICGPCPGPKNQPKLFSTLNSFWYCFQDEYAQEMKCRKTHIPFCVKKQCTNIFIENSVCLHCGYSNSVFLSDHKKQNAQIFYMLIKTGLSASS